MDCKTARLLLAFARPQAGEIQEADAADLERHMANCPACAEAARFDRLLDQQLGRAVRAVEVPAGMQTAILSRLEKHAKTWQRWVKRAGQIAAAAVLLLAAGLLCWHILHRPPLDLVKVHEEHNSLAQSERPSPASLQAYYRKLGFAVQPPDNFNYNLVIAFGVANLQGQQVPRLVFLRRGGPRGEDDPNHALVYLVSNRQFDLKALAESPELESGQYKVTVYHQAGELQSIVVVHNGEDVNWLKSEPVPAL
jgi:hypothetical protein